jgi:hypothetical protein
MKKSILIFSLVSIIFSATAAHGQNSHEIKDPGFILLDVLMYRPAGLIATVVGAGLYVGASPLIALASIPAPHDAFVKTGKILVVAPAAYTFIRPLGDRGI